MMNLDQLRRLLAPLIVELKDKCTHDTLPDDCVRLGLLPPDTGGTKADRLRAAFDRVSDRQLPEVAERFLKEFPPQSSDRNKIQDILWSDTAYPSIPKLHRRELARALQLGDLFLDAKRFDELLERLWVLDDPFSAPFGPDDSSLRALIERYVHVEHGGWDTEKLFDELGAFDAPSHRFGLFLEGLASAEVRPYANEQRRFVSIVNEALDSCGVELRETGERDGYPAFELVTTRTGTAGRPKNLIFASPKKPDIRIRDAVNNDIEIVNDDGSTLIYEKTIGADGLSWADLQSWWACAKSITDAEEAKKSGS